MIVSCMGDIAARGMENKLDRAYGETALKKFLPLLNGTDLRIANWENPTTAELTPIPKAGPNLHSDIRNIGFLTAAGVRLAVLANNHGGDMGADGIMETIAHLKNAGIDAVGAGINAEEAHRPYIFEKSGETLAIFAVCEHEYGFATDERAGTAAYDHILLRRQIAEAKQKYDFVMAIMHVGNEYCPIPSPLTRERFHDLADAGADAIIGMHPHCPQGYEIYNGTPIAYSTGNFFFGSPRYANRAVGWHVGYVPVLRFEKGQPTRMEIIPYQYDRSCAILLPFEGEKKEKMEAYLAGLNRAFLDKRLYRRLWEGWCVHVGEMYCFGFANFRKEYEQGLRDEKLYALTDLLTCESHHEMVSTYMRMLTEVRQEEARPGIEQVLALSKIPVSIFDNGGDYHE